MPPTSVAPVADSVQDLRHGPSRRILTDGLARFAAGLPDGARVLEVGAAHYDHRPFFPRQELVRLDFDPEAKPDVVGDAHEMPLDDQSFDATIAISVLEHVANPFKVVSEMFRVSRPGAPVFAWVPFIFAVHGYPGDISRFTDEGLQGCFEQAGFSVDSVDSESYAGLFFHLSNLVHFYFPRRSQRRWVRNVNRALFLPLRAAYPLDHRLKVPRMYVGVELRGAKPETATA